MLNNNLIKKDIVFSLSKKSGFSYNFSKNLIDNLINVLLVIIKEEKLNLKNIGSFTIVNKKERLGRNPKTKEEYIISSRKSVKFTPSKKIYKNFNKLL